MGADHAAQGVLGDLPVDGPVGAVAAGGPDAAVQDGGEGRLVELEHDPGAGHPPAHLGEVAAEPLGERRGEVAAGPGVAEGRLAAPQLQRGGERPRPDRLTFRGPVYPWVNSSSASRSSPIQEWARRVSRPGRSLTRHPLGSTWA